MLFSLAHSVFVRAADGFLKSTFKMNQSKLYELNYIAEIVNLMC